MTTGKYLEDTRHPWACILFVIPLLLAYEGGHELSGQLPGQQVRNGAEAWLRMGLTELGWSTQYAAPLLVLAILVGWSVVCRAERPRELVGVLAGMFVESILFAVGLYVLGQAIWPWFDDLSPLFDKLSMLLDTTSPGSSSGLDPVLEKALRCIGAGIYEEAMFRLGLFSLLCWLFRLADFPLIFGLLLASILSALAFALAHHLGVTTEKFPTSIFLFQALAGVYFAWLYRIRGLGIAIGAHTAYDVLVGIVLPML